MLGRRWLAFENDINYISASILRFLPKEIKKENLLKYYNSILNCEQVNIETQINLFNQSYLVSEEELEYPKKAASGSF